MTPLEAPDALGPARVQLEAEQVKRALDGDGRAFAQLVRPHLAVLYRIAARACGDAAMAEDAVQEALALAYRQLGRYRPGTSLGAFLTAIAVKRAHTLLRGERRRRGREEATEPPADQATPIQALEAARTGRLIRDALGRMPKKRRTAALLRLDGGLSNTEIAQAMTVKPEAARALVSLALRELRQMLSEAEVSG